MRKLICALSLALASGEAALAQSAAATATPPANAYAALVSAAIRRHTPATGSFGNGFAACRFHIDAAGSPHGVSCSATRPAQATFLRQVILSTSFPPPPGGRFFAEQPIAFKSLQGFLHKSR
jgi:hypothetical protein